MSAAGPIKALIVPGHPHPLLAADQNEGWMRIRKAFEAAREEIIECDPDVILVYSTLWISIIGHQIQARPEPEWVHVDELFHDLGSIPYRFKIDTELADGILQASQARGLQARTVDYHGFPIDTGSVVALKLLNPDNRYPASIVSSNIYADRAESVVFAKAAVDALKAQNKRAVVVLVTSLSNRMFTDFIDPKDDRIHSAKDEEWNRKILEFLDEGRLEDVAQLSRQIHQQIRISKVVNFKPMWWLSAVMGQSNRFTGHVYDYAPMVGCGSAVVSLTPSTDSAGNKEYDEDDAEHFSGDRNVLAGKGEAQSGPAVGAASASRAPTDSPNAVRTEDAPKPVGPYPHARREGEFIFVSGMGPRQPGTDEIPGGPVRDSKGKALNYDIAAQTRAVIENVKTVLEAAGSKLGDVIDITCFLIDMDRDFKTFNEVYREYFESIGPTRTTLAVTALPTPIAVELKVIAKGPA